MNRVGFGVLIRVQGGDYTGSAFLYSKGIDHADCSNKAVETARGEKRERGVVGTRCEDNVEWRSLYKASRIIMEYARAVKISFIQAVPWDSKLLDSR